MIPSPSPSSVQMGITPESAPPSGAVIGGIVGGIVTLLTIIAIVGYLLVLRGRRAERSSLASTVTPFHPSITPEAQDGYDGSDKSQLNVAGLPPSWHVTPFVGSISEHRQSETKSGHQSGRDVQLGTQGSHAPAQALVSHPLDNVGATSWANNIPTMDMQAVFQDRRFEGHLLRFIMQRINSRGGRGEDNDEGSVAPPPTYREARSTS